MSPTEHEFWTSLRGSRVAVLMRSGDLYEGFLINIAQWFVTIGPHDGVGPGRGLVHLFRESIEGVRVLP